MLYGTVARVVARGAEPGACSYSRGAERTRYVSGYFVAYSYTKVCSDFVTLLFPLIASWAKGLCSAYRRRSTIAVHVRLEVVC